LVVVDVPRDVVELAFFAVSMNVVVVVVVVVAAAAVVLLVVAVVVVVDAVVVVNVVVVVDVTIVVVVVEDIVVLVVVVVIAVVSMRDNVVEIPADDDVLHCGRARLEDLKSEPQLPPHNALQVALRDRVCAPVPQPSGAHAPHAP